MTSNNCSFLGKHFTQIDGATIGGANAGSVTDIYGAEYIDKIIYEKCPLIWRNIKDIKMIRLT